MSKLIMIGDATEVIAPMRDNFVDLIVTSPPYDNMRDYNGYRFNWEVFIRLAHQMYRILKPGGVLVWVVGDQTKNGSETLTSFKQALYFKDEAGFLAHDTMIYHNHKPPQNHRRYEPAFEYMFVMTKGTPKTFNGLRTPKLYPEKKQRMKGWGRWQDNSRDMGTSNIALKDRLESNVWKINWGKLPANKQWLHDHPAMFPEELALRHVRTWTNPGDMVLDPFCGSGTTGFAATTEGRRFIGIDVSPQYASMTCRRVGVTKAFEWRNSNVVA